jgi:valyl-tRNA synthetase
MIKLQLIVSGIRENRKDRGVPEKKIVDAILLGVAIVDANVLGVGSEENTPLTDLIAENRAWLERLSSSRITETVDRFGDKYAHLNWRRVGGTDIAIIYEKQIDVPGERTRLQKDIAQNEKIILNAERQLGNEGFLSKAPPHVVEGLKKQRDEAQRRLDQARRDLDALPPE